MFARLPGVPGPLFVSSVLGLAAALGQAQAQTALIDLGEASTPSVSSVTVLGQRDNALDHATGLAVLPTTIQDAPQTINVTELLRAQAVQTLDAALRNVPGV